MKVRMFRQRVSQVHECEVEVNDWLSTMGSSITVNFVAQSSYLTDNTENAQPGYIISVWYTEN